jgi:hypothetical protein
MRVRGLVLAFSICAVLGGGLLAVTSAFAVAPETPETGVASSVSATTATLEGVLNPHATAAVEGGEYEFLYNYSPTECENVFVAPEPAGIALGFPKEAVSTKVTGLQPSLKYTVCLEEQNKAAPPEVAKGLPVTFETSAAPPTIASESAPEVKASEAILAATVNPNNQEATFVFQYATKATGETLEGPVTTIQGEGPIAGYEEPGFGVQVTTGAVLTQDTTYYYRVIARNAKGEQSLGKVELFTTPTPEAPEARAASAITSSTADLNGTLNPKHPGEGGTYDFVYERSPTQCHQENSTPVPEPPETALGKEAEAESITVSGLLPGATYTYCLVAHTPQGEATGPPVTFTTLAVGATASEESFSKVGSSSAELHARINPGGAPTTYFFEYGYGPVPTYGSVTPVESAGDESEPVSVLAKIEELKPDTTYYFRVVASNTQGPVGTGQGGSFSTFPAESLGLPDGRAFEEVSPLDNGDATVLTGSPVRAAANGSALTYIGTASPHAGNGEITIQAGIRPEGDNVYLAKRAVGGGWTAADIQPDGFNKAFYQGFSSDLSVGILGSEQALLQGAPNGVGNEGLYTRDNSNGDYSLLGASANYAASTPDGLHVLFHTVEGLYDSFRGMIEKVSVLPGGEPDPNATFGATTGDLEHVISNDGARIFWTDTITGDLYVRENDTQPDARTLLISETARFQTASSNGTKVFFTNEKQLTVSSTAATGAPDLYEYNLETRTLTDLTIDTNQGEHANVVGVLGTNPAGSYTYFAAAANLTNSTKPQECRQPSEGEPIGNKCNVYVVHEHETPKLVATVATADGEGGLSRTAEVIHWGTVSLQFGDWVAAVGLRSAYVSDDGHKLVFESVEDLTMFHADGGREIYQYDTDSGVSCVSCNPSGASTIDGPFFKVAHAELPSSFSSAYALRDISADGNRVFFDSNEGLVSQITNEEALVPAEQNTKGLTNVYEWERDGTGSCGRAAGCIYLLSPGASSDISFFVDASESGSDVFVATRARLVSQGQNEVYEAYDAHECTGAAPCPREISTACTGTGCQGLPSAPPIFATPSSVTFAGIGNFTPSQAPLPVKPKTAAQLRAEKLAKTLKACKRDKAKKKRAACEKSARKRYGVSKTSTKPKKASNSRGIKR